MIAPLRMRQTRLLAISLGVVPLGLAAALVTQPRFPAGADPWIQALPADAERYEHVLAHELQPAPIAVYLDVDDPAVGTVLKVLPLETPAVPDPLVYASPTASTAGDALPPDATFLGTLRQLSDPTPLAAVPAHLIVYSLAHGRVVSSLPVRSAL